MAMTAEWERVSERFGYLQRYEALRPVVVAMHRLVGALNVDPRLHDVEPSVSLGSLNLNLRDSKRYINVVWTDDAQGFKVSMVDPPLLFSQTKIVSDAEVVPTIIDYLNLLKNP